jgi:hypothetical protein
MACANITGNGAKNQKINEFNNRDVTTRTASSWLTVPVQTIDATLPAVYPQASGTIGLVYCPGLHVPALSPRPLCIQSRGFAKINL